MYSQNYYSTIKNSNNIQVKLAEPESVAMAPAVWFAGRRSSTCLCWRLPSLQRREGRVCAPAVVVWRRCIEGERVGLYSVFSFLDFSSPAPLSVCAFRPVQTSGRFLSGGDGQSGASANTAHSLHQRGYSGPPGLRLERNEESRTSSSFVSDTGHESLAKGVEEDGGESASTVGACTFNL